jgi:hypothetical protein
LSIRNRAPLPALAQTSGGPERVRLGLVYEVPAAARSVLGGGDLMPERVERRQRDIAELNATWVRFTDARRR